MGLITGKFRQSCRENWNTFVRFEVVTALMKKERAVFRDVVPHSFVIVTDVSEQHTASIFRAEE
jgi:hypothetical protein